MARNETVRASPPWSGLLLFTLAAAVLATVGLVLAVVFASMPPPPPPPSGSNRPPPPPPGGAAIIVTSALFVLSWGAVMFTYLRDLFEHRFAQLSNRIVDLTAEYGELRETDGYLHGYRQASGGGGSPVRSLHPVPPTE